MRSQRWLLLALLALPVLLLVFLYLRSPTISDTHTTLPDEIFGLLHFVTSPDEAGRVITIPDTPDASALGGPIAPDKPVEMAWYALGAIAKHRQHRSVRSSGWDDRLAVLRTHHPLVVFSKSSCPYSKRAKRLLEGYKLLPAPTIIQVDLREDGDDIKTLLIRLTGHSTFPNVILHGHSLGGSDDLVRLHEEGRLRQVLENGGMRVGGETVSPWI